MTDEVVDKTDKAEKIVDRTVKLWHVVLATVALMISVGGKVSDLKTEVSNQRLEIEYLKSISRDQGLQNRDINIKLENILITLQNKEDRNKN